MKQYHIKFDHSGTGATECLVTIHYSPRKSCDGIRRGVFITIAPFNGEHLDAREDGALIRRDILGQARLPHENCRAGWLGANCPAPWRYLLRPLPRANEKKTREVVEAFEKHAVLMQIIVDYARGLTPRDELNRIPNTIAA